jgi:DNA-binding PucR family transcriptional regulator
MSPQLTSGLNAESLALEPPAGLPAAADPAVRQALNAFVAMRRSDDPGHIIDLVVSTALLLAPVPSVWAGWKCDGAPLKHATVFDPTAATAGIPSSDVSEQLEAGLEAWAPRLVGGQPPFEAEDPRESPAGAAVTVLPMSAGSRLGALVLGAPLCELTRQLPLLSLLCDRALAALELTSERQSGQRAAALAEALTQLAACYSDPELVLQTIVRSTAGLLGMDAAYVMLADGDLLRVRTAHGITSRLFYESTIAVDELLPSKAIRHRRVVCVRDLASHDKAKNSRHEGLRTTLCAPMFVEDQLIGLLMAAHREIRELSQQDRTTMMALANAAAVSIGNARLCAEHKHSIAELAELNATLADRSAAGEQTIAFQQRLTALVLQGGSLDEIVRVMSNTLRCEVLILDRELAVLHASDDATAVDPERVRDAVASLGDATGITRMTVEQSRMLVAPLALAGARSAYVVVIEDDDANAGPQLAMMTETAVTAIGLELMRERASAEAEARLTGGLFGTLLSDEDVDEAAILRRGSYLGYDLAGANVVIAVATADQQGVRRPLSLETCIHRAIRRRGEGPVAVFERDEAIFVVLSDPVDVTAERIKEYTAAIKQELDASGRSAGVRIAHAGPHHGVAGVRLAVNQAQYALHVLGVLGRTGKPHAFGDLGVWTLLGRVGDAEHLTSFAESVLGVLIEHDRERQSQLVDTIRTLVECNFHYRTAAELLFTHPNTLRYRMSRINELTGLDFADADDRLKVEIALRILDVIAPARG